MLFESALQQNPALPNVGFRVLHRFGYTPREAEQEALVTLWEISNKPSPPARVAPSYLGAALVNAEIDRLRKTERQHEHCSIDCMLVAARQPADIDDFMDIIRPLNTAGQELIFAAYVEGLTYEELADRYGVPVGTIRSRISRAIEFIKQRMARNN